jgi:phage terminase large subunit GpA-like protein
MIGTQAIKGEVISRLDLKIKAGPKKMHFPRAYCNAEYFKQLTAEHLIKKNTGMVDYYVYEKKKKDLANEALDLMVYNYAALKHCVPNFTALKYKYDEESAIINRKENELNDVKTEVEPEPGNAWGRGSASGWE